MPMTSPNRLAGYPALHHRLNRPVDIVLLAHTATEHP